MKIKSCVLFLILIVFSLSGCGSDKAEIMQNKASDERVAEAIEIISEHWEEVYQNHSLNDEDKYLEITNTKLINIKPNNDMNFKDVKYIVEFSLESNYYDSAPYYSNIGSRDSFVAVYTDGSKEVLEINPFHKYIRLNGPTDFNEIIESIENFYGEYDQVLTLK